MINRDTTETVLPVRAEVARARANLYALASRVFMREVDGVFLDVLKSGHMKVTFADTGMGFTGEGAAESDSEILEVLDVEYAALFLVSGNVLSPYESVSKEGRLCGKAATKAASFYKKAWFEVSRSSTLFPDHFAIELEFMGHLLDTEARAIENSDEAMFRRTRELEAGFMSSHLGTWYRPFLEKVKRVTESPFYRDMASFTMDFLDSEIEYLGTETDAHLP